MVKRYFLLMTVLVLGLTACKHDVPMPEPTSAAADLYRQYCNRDNLTVAMIGDYKTSSGTHNAVMLQASDSATWHALTEEFGVSAIVDTLSDPNTLSGLNNLPASVQVLEIDADDEQDLAALVQHLVDSVTSAGNTPEPTSMTPPQQIVDIVTAHQHIGYMLQVDPDEHILWVFFFDTTQQIEQVIHKIIEE